MYKQKILIILLSLFSANACYASLFCPNQQVKAICENGTWQVSISREEGWTRYSEEIVGVPCNTPGDRTENVRWNYTGESGKHSNIYCLYTLIDNQMYEIGQVNIVSNDRYSKTGDNWKQGDLPNEWECYYGRADCTFQ